MYGIASRKLLRAGARASEHEDVEVCCAACWWSSASGMVHAGHPGLVTDGVVRATADAFGDCSRPCGVAREVDDDHEPREDVP